VAIESPERTFISMQSIIFRIMNAANEGYQHRATRPDAPTDVETEIAEEGRFRDGWSGARLTKRSAALSA
jgi:hypothetical protein